DAQWKTPPIAHGRIGDDEIIPAKPMEVGVHPPIGTPGFDCPIGYRAICRELQRRYLALHVPGLLEPRHFTNETPMLVFRPDRLVAGHLHEASLAHVRVWHCPSLAAPLGKMVVAIKLSDTNPALPRPR